MNFFLFILSIGGLCYGLESNHHYKYKYSAYFKSGIPDDGNEEVGMAMKAILHVFVENNDGIAIFKLSDVSTFNFNEDLGEVDFKDKRFHHLEDEDLSLIFEQPFRVNLRDSDPFAIEHVATEHRWLSNVLKGIASMLKNEILKGNFVTKVKDSIPSLFHQGHLVNNFYVDEETIFGICKAKYNIHQIPDTMFTGSNDLTPIRQDGAKKDLWHVTRTIDFLKCSEIVALHVHTTNNRRHKHKKLKFTRTSVSSYVLRGSPGHFDLYSVLTEGATTYPLSLFNENEEAQSTVKQKLVLIDEGPSEVLPELGANLTHSRTWMHEVWSPFQRPKEGKPHPWIVYPNENKPHAAFEMFGTKELDDDQIALAKTKIIEIIKKSSRMLADLDQEAENFPPEAISESLQIASYFFRFLKKKDYLKIFDHIFEGNVEIEELIDLLTDVYSDVSQDLHVRTAALLAIISWEPNTKFWYNLALSTWNDPSKEFASFASSLIKTYAEDNLPSLQKQKERAAYALKFAKPPSKSSSSYNFEFYKAFFGSQEKFSLLFSMVSKTRETEISDVIFNILTNIEQLSLFKIEKYHLYGESVTNYNETVQKDYTNIPQAEEFLEKLYSTLPAVFCITREHLPPTSGLIGGFELQLSGISIFLPWSRQYSTAMKRTNLELKIPIGVKSKRIVGNEGPLRSSKTSFEFPYKKKFPLFHLSSTPMTVTYDTVQILENDVMNFKIIKKSNVKEKLISEINPHTGIKYDLVMRADTPTSFGLRDFLQFPDISFRVWSLDFYLDLEESETKELLVTHSSESRKENNEISFQDNFGERSRKITNLMKTSKRTNYIRYQVYKLDFIGKFSRQIEFFNAAEMIEGPHLHYYRFESVGFTSSALEKQQHILKSVCFNLHSSQYSGFDKYYYDSSSALPKHEIKEWEFEVLRGCTENIFTANVFYNYSEESSNKTKEYCKTNYGEEKCYIDDYKLLLPDDIRVTIHNGNVKNSYHGHWDLYLNKDSEDIFLSTFPDNTIIQDFLNYPSQFTSFDIPFLRETVQKCTLTNTSVSETFDGLNFNYELSNCWTLVSETEGRVFLIRKPQGESSIPDFKYFKFDKGTVNGSIINTSDTVISSFIYKKGNTYLIFDKYGGIDIIVSKNKIEYYKTTRRLKSNGICGSDYGKSIPELVGPKKCVYDDSQMFTASWTGESENCDAAVLKEYRKEVEDFQTKCKPYDGQPIESVVNPRCLFFGWKILTISDHSYCISANPLPFCSSQCDIKKVKTVEMAYKCWPKEKAPSRLRTSIENKDDVITDLISAEPYFHEFSSTEIAKICKQF
ncbi:Hemolymph clottable protein [Armadillidium nasatum]|uniref:Hemolymph clottable protein n=1 Tax=Armadillidium nasatum TaxID=96803 RepID=A0A5N5SPA2_9CRUS|nr:Hemolymph clottable protein [Armadillidium nasatum]